MAESIRGPIDVSRSSYARFKPIPVAATLVDGFAGPRQAANRSRSIPDGDTKLETAGNYLNLRIAAGSAEGTFVGTHPFQDSDVFKYQEAIGFELGNGNDDALRATLERTANLVAAAQEPDGYLNTCYQIRKHRERWSNLKDDHELYNAGHLFQAAVAAHRNADHATLLDVSKRFADLAVDLFGPGKIEGLCGHPEVETALIELGREMRDGRYIELAKLMLDRRGRGLIGGDVYHQDHKPIRDVDELVGHAVRQLYLNAGVVDLYLETGEAALLEAQRRLWSDLERHKLYITGGIGARHQGEAFGNRYELPNESAYCETCAQLAGFFWAWRMLLATGDGVHADLMEQLLYNSIASGVSLGGDAYFYVNPLATRDATHVRKRWHSCACCPPNVMRTLASLGHYVATTDASGVQIHLYLNGQFSVARDDGKISIAIETNYPWDERIRLRAIEAGSRPMALRLRVPRWCKGASLVVNGASQSFELQDGYATLHRTWSAGDVVELTLPMSPVWVEAHPAIESVRGQLALQRGPITFCVEAADVEGGVAPDWLRVDPATPIEIAWQPELLGGIVTATFDATAIEPSDWATRLYRPASKIEAKSRTVSVRAIPYAVWGNRGGGAMRVWLRGDRE